MLPLIRPANDEFDRMGRPVAFPDAVRPGLQYGHDKVDNGLRKGNAGCGSSNVDENLRTALVFEESKYTFCPGDTAERRIDPGIRDWGVLTVEAPGPYADFDRDRRIARAMRDLVAERIDSTTEFFWPHGSLCSSG
jgi:hypothetical protein